MDDSKVTKATLGYNEEHKAESHDLKKKRSGSYPGLGRGLTEESAATLALGTQVWIPTTNVNVKQQASGTPVLEIGQ